MKRTFYIITLVCITVICMVIGLIRNISGFSLDDISIHAGKSVSDSEQLDSFSKIDIDMNVGDVEIVVGEDYEISYDCSEKMVPTYECKDGVLVVEQKKKTTVIGPANSGKCNMIITVPQKDSIKEATVDLAVGEFKLQDFELQSLDLDLNVGDVKFSNVACVDLNVSTNTGDTKLENIKFDTLKIESNVGDVNVGVSKKVELYSMDLKTDIGDVKVNGEEKTKSFAEKVDGKCSITVENNVGDIVVSDAARDE